MDKVRVICCVLILLFAYTGVLHGEERSDEERNGEEQNAEEHNPLEIKNNSFSFSVGEHLLPDNKKFMDYWDIKKEDFDGTILAIQYERSFFTYLGVEFSLGKVGSESKVHFTDSYLILDTYFGSATAKLSLPIGSSLVLYIGGGADYYTSYVNFSLSGYETSDTLSTTGYHGLAGVEYVFYSHPEKHGFLDMPVGFFIEYRHARAIMKKFDEKPVDLVNTLDSTSEPAHDLDLGGSSALAGIRWHY